MSNVSHASGDSSTTQESVTTELMPSSKSLTPIDVNNVSPTLDVSLTANRYVGSRNAGALSFSSITEQENAHLKKLSNFDVFSVARC